MSDQVLRDHRQPVAGYVDQVARTSGRQGTDRQQHGPRGRCDHGHRFIRIDVHDDSIEGIPHLREGGLDAEVAAPSAWSTRPPGGGVSQRAHGPCYRAQVAISAT
jgi:hypothetical protein